MSGQVALDCGDAIGKLTFLRRAGERTHFGAAAVQMVENLRADHARAASYKDCHDFLLGLNGLG